MEKLICFAERESPKKAQAIKQNYRPVTQMHYIYVNGVSINERLSECLE